MSRMTVLLAAALLVIAASAAPRYNSYQRQHLSDFVLDDTFDTHRFWEGLEAAMHLEHLLDDFYKQFPSSVNSEGVDGTQYKVVISLPGFRESEIVVKAREGTLMVQASRDAGAGAQHSYLDIRTLPSYIDVAGSWSYSDGVLTIVFPVRKESGEEGAEGAPSTTEGGREREEMEPHDRRAEQDADVLGLSDTGSRDDQSELSTNQIASRRGPVEATTYAVDLNNEIEFVPVSLK